MGRRQPLPIAGRVIAVTGGARGIGRATAAALVARGGRGAIGDLDGELAEQVAGELGAVGLPLDVTDRDSFAGFLDEVGQRLGPLDVLVNNAGVMHVGAFLDEDEAWTRRMVDINLHGVILGMRLALPAMRARGSGHVVNLASVAARIGVPREAVYAATKHAVAGLTDSVRAELRGSGVELTLVYPGLVQTDLAAGTTKAKGTTVLTPDQVAAAIVSALEKPRFDVHVPREYSLLVRALALLPRRPGWALRRALGAERAPGGATAAERAGYESRMEALAPDKNSIAAP